MEEWFGIAVLAVCSCVCGAAFLGFALFARRCQKPVWFWSGSTVDPAAIADVPAYNRANSRMWAAYSLPFWACGLLGLWQPFAAGIILAAACIGGIPVLVLVYRKILKKYKVDSYK